jgi:ABC-2 type transport system permease protein
MKHILDITFKDLLELMRNRMTFLFFLIMPVVFTLLFGFAFSGVGKVPEDSRLPVGFINQDGGPLSQELTALLNGSTVFRLVEDSKATPATLEKQVADKKMAAAILIPPGYSEATLSDTPMQLTLIVDTSSLSGMTIQNDALAAVNRLMNAVRTAQIVSDVIRDPSVFNSAVTETLAAWQDPPIRVADRTSASTGTRSGNSAGSFSHTSPGMMLQFAIAGLLTAAQVLVTERKSRCLQRLLTTAVSRAQILLGHYLAIVLLLLAQFLLLILFGQLFLKLDYLRQAGATLLVALTSALCIGGLGLLIGVLAKSEEQAIMFSLIPMFILSALGGAWVPLEITGPTFSTIGHVSPVAWALDGFENIVARGLGIGSVLIPAAALIGYALLFFLLAAWRFQRISE